MNQIHSIHASDGCSRHIDMKPLLRFTENILQNALPTTIDTPATPQEAQTQLNELLEDYDGHYDFLKLYLAQIIKRTSCKISCTCGQSAYAATLEVFKTLSSFTWETKVVLALAAFSVTYGKFWLVAQPSPTNLLAKSIAILEQLPDMLADKEPWKPKFEAPSNLIKTILKVTKCVVEFWELLSEYMTDGRGMPTAAAHIPTAVYWTIHGMVVCTKRTMCLTDMGQEDIDQTMEDWYLSSLDHKLSQIHDYLKEQLAVCRQHIRERREIEAYKMIEHLLKTPQIDNMKILGALICAKAEQLPLFDGLNKKRARLDVLWKKNVLLFISELEVPYQELSILEKMYLESRQDPTKEESQYEVVWLPVVDGSTPWNEEKDRHFETQKALMTWYSVFHPSLLETAAIKYIKEVWGFNKRPMLVALDPMGRVVNPNAIHMIYIWGPTVAFPFSKSREEGLWKEVTWGIELLAAAIHPMIVDWISEGKYICLYGGDDIEWIRKFTDVAKAVESAADIKLEMLYVGKSNLREKVRKNNDSIAQENLSHVLPDLSSVWFFWARLESMWHSKVQHGGENAERDPIMQEIVSMLSFDGGDHGWAVFGRGWGEMSQMTKAKGDTIVGCLRDYHVWKNNIATKGFVGAVNDYLPQLHTPHHCNRLVLPGTTGRTPDRVACAECGRPMEKFIMYRCCTD